MFSNNVTRKSKLVQGIGRGKVKQGN